MTPPDALVDRLLTEGSATRAYTALLDAGYTITRSGLEVRLSRMIAAGVRKKIGNGGFPQGMDQSSRGYEVRDHGKGCDALLAATQRLYARVARDRGCSIEAARIILNYSPAQIARLAA